VFPLRFRAVSGESVGGGVYVKTRLDSDEVVETWFSAVRVVRGYFDLSRGYLTLTDRRMIHTPHRWPFGSTLLGYDRALKPIEFNYNEIKDARVERSAEPMMPESSTVKVLIVTTLRGHRETFYPGIDAAEAAAMIMKHCGPTVSE